MSMARLEKNLESEYIAFVRETILELDNIMKVSVKEQMKDLAKSALGKSVRTKDPLFWPAGLLMLGLAEARRVLVDDPVLTSEIDAVILSHLQMWQDRYKSKIEFIDDAFAGAAAVLLYMQIGESGDRESEICRVCRDCADKIFKYLLAAPKDKDGVIVYNASRSSSIFVDGIGQTAMFLSLYGKCFSIERALELAEKQLLGFAKNGMDPGSQLPYHGYARLEDGTVEKKGVLSWGRAAGWLIMGLSAYVNAAEGGERNAVPEVKEKMRDMYGELSTALLTYMRPDGGYSWQVQAVDGHADSSATGMILYGLLKGGALKDARGEGDEPRGDRECDLKNEDGPRGVECNLKKCEEFLWSCVSDGKAGNALSSCDDFGVHYQNYGHYAWGQGAVLAALSLLIQ